MVANARQSIATLPLLTEKERHQLVVEEPNQRRVFAFAVGTSLLPNRRFARRRPSRWFDGRQPTYAQPDAQSNQLANYLRKRGAAAGARRHLRRSLAGNAGGVLGILKAGAAAYRSIRSSRPSASRPCSSDAQPSILLTQSAVSEWLGKGQADHLQSTGNGRTFSRKQTRRRPLPPSDHLRIFTSGSTGKTEGASKFSTRPSSTSGSMATRPGLNAGDTLVAVTTLAFDIAVLELYLPLCRRTSGHRHAAGNGGRQPAFGSLQNNRATVMQATPTTWRLLMEAGWNEPTNSKFCAAARRCRGFGGCVTGPHARRV